MSLNIAQIQTAAAAIGVTLSDDQVGMFARYRDLLVEWNERFNLTSMIDDTSILLRHFMDSLTVLHTLPVKRGISLLDVGTGAGMPGIPLKIARPDIDVTLMDSTGKKIDFCAAVIADLQLADIHTLKARSDEAAHLREHRAQYDAVVARALAPLPTLVEYLLPFARAGGLCIAMKGSDAQVESDQAARAIRTLGGALERIEAVTLPGLPDERALVIIRKAKPSPSLYPRAGGKPRTAPLT